MLRNIDGARRVFRTSNAGRTALLRKLGVPLFVLALGSFGSSGCLNIPGANQSKAPGDQAKRGAPKSADEVMARYVEGLGGKKALEAQKNRTTESEIVFVRQKDCEPDAKDCLAEDIQGQLVMYNSADQKMYQRTVVRDQVEERGFDGTESWSVRGEPSLLYLEPKSQQKAAREDAMLHWYLDYQKRGVKPELLKSRKVKKDGEQRWLDGVLWTADGKEDLGGRELWFDRQSGLLVEEVEKGEVPNQQGEPIETSQTLYFENYQPVDGLQVPHLIRQVTRTEGSKDAVVEIRVLSVNHSPVKASRYVMPKLPTPAPMADPMLGAFMKAKQDAQAQKKELTAQMELARKAYIVGNFDEADAAAKAALKLDPKDPEAHYIRGQIAGLLGDSRGLSSNMSKSKKYGAAEQPLSYLLAWAAVEARDYKNAAKYFESAKLPQLAERFSSLGKPKVSGKCRADFALQPAPVPTILVPGSEGALQLMVDTSASELVLSKSQAQKLLIMPEGQAPVTAGGPSAPYGTMATLDLGGIKISNVPVTILPDQAVAAMVGGDPKTVGIIGGRTLLDLALHLDPQKQTLSFVAQRSACKRDLKAISKGIEIPVAVHEGRFVFMPGAMKDARGMYLLNTGLRGAVVIGNTRAFMIAGVAPESIRTGEVPMVSLPKFSLLGRSNHEMTGVPAAYGLLQDQWTGAGFRLDGMVGSWVFGARPWTLDMKSRRVWIGDAPPAPKTPAAPKGAKATEKKGAKK